MTVYIYDGADQINQKRSEWVLFEVRQGIAGASDPITYNDRQQVTSIDGLAQGFLDQGNDLRTTTGPVRTINGPMGVTAYQQGSQTVFLSRAPSGQLLTARPTGLSSTSFYFITEPNGNVAGLTDPYGFYVGSYQYSPYGKTTTGGLGHFNPFRYLGEWQETTAGGDPGHYKLGARYYDTSGMFTQPDALTGNMGDPRTMTAYNYAGADPINQADPSGYWSWDAFNETLGNPIGNIRDAAGIAGACIEGGGLGSFLLVGSAETLGYFFGGPFGVAAVSTLLPAVGFGGGCFAGIAAREYEVPLPGIPPKSH